MKTLYNILFLFILFFFCHSCSEDLVGKMVSNDIKIIGTRTGLDGQPATFIATSHPDGQNLKTYFTIPSEFATNKNDFSNTVTNFSSTTATFDDTTP